MSLANFKPATIAVVVNKDVTLNLRGLNFFDISELIKIHQADLGGVFDLYEKNAGNFSNIAMGSFAVELLKNAPGLVAHAIALSCDEPELADRAQLLPIIKQMDALEALAKLTFEEVGGVKKLIQTVTNLFAQLKPEIVETANSHVQKQAKRKR